MYNLKFYLILFAAGCVLGTLAEFTFHTSALTHYPPVFDVYRLWGWYPIWAPFLFGAASVGIVRQNMLILRYAAFGIEPKVMPLQVPVLSVLFFFVVWSTISRVPLQTGSTKDALLWILCLAYWILIEKKSKTAVIQGITTGLVGTLFECALGFTGLYIYRSEDANFLSIVPSWLLPLYFLAGITIGSFAHVIKAQGSR